MKSLSSSAVAVSRELSSSSYHPSIRPNKCNVRGASEVIAIPNSRLMWFKSTNNRSSSFSLLAISSDQAVAAAASTASDPELTWQILVGALAGVIPFIVAAIEFSKRIVAQKKCEICQGSGLVLMDNKDYIRCPDCGGFLPWQSWRRFFSG
ncbi:putative Transmembrane protein [Heracleum sosnowskyi]|uniref:Transmembrane protein n=1 Tax=Heracleum sosnowskyi TaxID=360622 RepID=A0AAD8H6T4_9APIA|nr:putative Transmembrane protein [Heracleum sosnowskyi]